MAFKWFKKKKQQAPAEISPTKTEGSDIPLSEADLPDTASFAEEAMPQSTPPTEEERQIAEASVENATGFFQRLKQGLSKTREILTTDIDDLFAGFKKVDDDMLEELEERLITSDIGVQTTNRIIQNISKKASRISSASELKTFLKKELLALLPPEKSVDSPITAKPYVVMVVGVNGVGKTTTIGKMAAKASRRGEKVLIAAADTFRAAAIEQLVIWAKRAGAEIVKHKDNSDPAAVAFDGVAAAMARDMDKVYIDTAGRLHTKTNLMEELKKIKRAISKKLPDAPHEILLVLDATTGQNAISQAAMFSEELGITGLVLTKLDGTARGGIVISICNSLGIPLKHIGVGESIDDLQDFDARKFVNAIL